MTRNPLAAPVSDEVWFKSSYSNNQGGNCVEAADCARVVRVRDSKDMSIPGLTVSKAAWASFIASMQE
ncbi:DUF397 domain-containing protein [Streptomyces sp. NPDC057654]|uniref:DUF397 domain-containing protein n=1 Tax=Streptomyces sp. NPDC057654 TaxID=3346196 RepID=UPI0036890190